MVKKFTRNLSYFFIVFTFLIPITVHVHGQTINTIAGNGTPAYGGDGGPSTSSEINFAEGIAVDASYNIFIGDQENQRVRKITAGIITTIAGTGFSGYSGNGGPATDAQLNTPTGVSVDRYGNIYIADFVNSAIRKVDATTQIITTIAGTGTQGFSGDGGPATNAQLNYPLNVAVDSSGNVFISDAYNYRIRRIDAVTGIITTFAGTGFFGYSGDGGPATNAEMTNPWGLAVDDSDNVYITDTYNDLIRKVNSTTGIITSVVGDGVGGYAGDGGSAMFAEISLPTMVALDPSGNMYIADFGNSAIREVNKSTGIITSVTGIGFPGYSGDGGPATAAEIDEPWGVAVDSCSNVYLTDYGNNRAREVAVIPAIDILPTVASLCSGSSINLTTSGAYSYTWSPATGLNTTTGSSVMANPQTTITYTVSGTDKCNRTGTTSIAVTITPAPPLDIEPQSPLICSGQFVDLGVVGGGSGFTWSPSTALNNTTGDSVTANPTITLTYTVTGTDSGGCTAIGTDEIDVIPAPNKPTINISITDDSLISSATQGNQWYRNDTIIAGATNQDLTIIGQTKGSYTVEVINPANGCTATSDSLVTSGVNQLSVISEQLSIYPNPSTGNIFITLNSSVQAIKDWNLQVTDVLGRIVLTTSALNYSNDIKLPNADGVYFITIVNKTARAVFTVVRQQ